MRTALGSLLSLGCLVLVGCATTSDEGPEPSSSAVSTAPTGESGGAAASPAPTGGSGQSQHPTLTGVYNYDSSVVFDSAFDSGSTIVAYGNGAVVRFVVKAGDVFETTGVGSSQPRGDSCARVARTANTAFFYGASGDDSGSRCPLLQPQYMHLTDDQYQIAEELDFASADSFHIKVLNAGEDWQADRAFSMQWTNASSAKVFPLGLNDAACGTMTIQGDAVTLDGCSHVAARFKRGPSANK